MSKLDQMKHDRIVHQFKERLVSLLGADLVLVHWFGSSARGRADEDSDIDLLIETQAPLPPGKRDQIADLAVDFCADFGTLVDMHYYTTWELTHPPYANSPFVQTVLEEGVKV